MEYAELGSSGVEVSRVVFGAWAIGGWMWGGADEGEAVAAIRQAVELGVTTIDTAPIYGFGRSEEIVGRAIEGIRDKVVIVTKCGLRWEYEGGGEAPFESTDSDGTRHTVRRCLGHESVLEEADRSLQRLGTDHIDLYQCHWPDSTTPLAETMEAMNQLLAEGKVRAVGVSNFTPEMIDECRRYTPITSDQPLYNMLDRAIEDDVLPHCAEHGVSVIVYSPLHQALLTGKVTMDRMFPADDLRSRKPWFRPENRRRVLEFLDRVHPIAEQHGKTLAQVAINWCLCQNGVTATLVGARRPEQVRENAGGAGWRLQTDELAEIRGWLEELGAPA
jgi:aryl-alcohol dehydrogenase-like predicted oxidoreductase